MRISIISNYFLISIIVILTCGIVSYIIFKRDASFEGTESIFASLGVSLIAFLILLIVGFVLCICTSTNITTTYNTETELVSLNDFTSKESNTNGYMFLFVGGLSEDTSDTYNVRYASRDDNGIIKIKTITVNSNNIGFIEDDNAKIITTYEKREKKFNGLGKWLFGDKVQDEQEEVIGYEFHMPKGSITDDIEIDLK